MKTRRKQNTRKGGKNAKQNLLNYTRYWHGRQNYREYNVNWDYPGYFKKMMGDIPKESRSSAVNTYTFTRHGYSCANLLKSKKSYQQHTDPDPSLTLYGILSILKTVPLRPNNYNDHVFVSPLIRTWQTAILEYGTYGNTLTLVVSPYIKEKHSYFKSLDVSNMPLPIAKQIGKMKEFLQALNVIPHPHVRHLLTIPIRIIYENKQIPLQGVFQPYKVDSSLINTLIEKNMDRKHERMETDVFISLSKNIPRPSLREYYGGKGFVYFDHWVREKFPEERTIFVVSHSGFMKSIIKEYTIYDLKTPIFNQNAWKLQMIPIQGKFNYKISIIPGLLKADGELSQMSKQTEPLCHRLKTTPELEYNPYIGEPVVFRDEAVSRGTMPRHELQSHYENPLIDDIPDYADLRDAPLGSPEDRDVALSRGETPEEWHRRRYAEKLLPEGYKPNESVYEIAPFTEPTEVTATRCYYEMIEFFKNPTNAANLSKLFGLSNPRDAIISYIQSNPTLFQNPYVAFVLIYRPYLNHGIEWLTQSVNQTAASFLLQWCFQSLSPKAVSILLTQVRDLIDSDKQVYELLLSHFLIHANKHYYYKYPPNGYVFTLLDFISFQFGSHPFTEETIVPTYRFIMDLVEKGARFSKDFYVINGVKADGKTLNGCPIVTNDSHTMVVELDPVSNELESLMLSQKKMYETESVENKKSLQSQIDRTWSSYKKEMNEYLQLHLAEEKGNSILDKRFQGGARGTSWKKTSLRRFSVKGGRYRALRYKGKRRSRVNRS